MEIVSRTLQAHFYDDDDTEHPFPASLHYDAGDPLAATMVMPLMLMPNGGPSFGVQTWRFSRDLLIDSALYGQDAGKGGDVFIQPTRSGFRRVLLVHLSSNEEHVHILLPTFDVRSFVNQTLAIVGQGHEDYSAQIDAGLRAMFA